MTEEKAEEITKAAALITTEIMKVVVLTITEMTVREEIRDVLNLVRMDAEQKAEEIMKAVALITTKTMKAVVLITTETV